MLSLDTGSVLKFLSDTGASGVPGDGGYLCSSVKLELSFHYLFEREARVKFFVTFEWRSIRQCGIIAWHAEICSSRVKFCSDILVHLREVW